MFILTSGKGAPWQLQYDPDREHRAAVVQQMRLDHLARLRRLARRRHCTRRAKLAGRLAFNLEHLGVS